MGRTARFDQIYVASLEAEPVENETLTGVNSILTREIEANEVKLVDESGTKGRLALANNIPTKQFSVGNKLFIDKDDTHVFDLKASGRADRIFINNQLAVGTINPTNAFQVNDGNTNKVNIDLSGKDLMTVNGNLVTTNLIIRDQLTFGTTDTQGKLIIDGLASNIITVNGDMKTSNLSVGSNVFISDVGHHSVDYPNNVAVITGNVTVDGVCIFMEIQECWVIFLWLKRRHMNVSLTLLLRIQLSRLVKVMMVQKKLCCYLHTMKMSQI